MYIDEIIMEHDTIKPWNPKQLDPALMTLDEYAKLCNENNKWHPSSAYDISLDRLNAYGKPKSEFKPVRRFRINGLDFEIMIRAETNKYAVRNPDPAGFDPYVKVDGQILYYTEAERDRLGLQPTSYQIVIFHEESRVAVADDEWGAMLVQVAQEYRAFGLGTILGKFARTLEPTKPSGGFTNAGFRNFKRVHSEFVRDALSSGLYSKLVRCGALDMERLREIISSAKINIRSQKQNIDLSNNNPSTWLLFSDDGTFVLYDRKLFDLLTNDAHGVDGAHVEKMIKGYVNANPREDAGVTRLNQFGADTPMLRSFMLRLAYTYASSHKLPLWVEPTEYEIKGFKYGPESRAVGYLSKEVLDGPMVDYREMIDEERRFRKRFDRYDEFLNRMHEMAYSKFRE